MSAKICALKNSKHQVSKISSIRDELLQFDSLLWSTFFMYISHTWNRRQQPQYHSAETSALVLEWTFRNI